MAINLEASMAILFSSYAFQSVAGSPIDTAFSRYIYVYLIKLDCIGEDYILIHPKNIG
jgi:hypothetical protein